MPGLKPLAAVLAVTLGGCASLQPHPTPAVPDNWFHATDARAVEPAALAHWWQRFDDPVLTALVQRAMSANPETRLAMLRVRASRAQLRQARAGLFPIFDLPGSASRQWIDTEAPAGSRRQLDELGLDLDDGLTIETWELALQASWELDLFGATRARVASSREQIRSAEAQAIGARLSVAANAAQAYVQIRALQAQLAIAQQGIEIAGELAHVSARLFEVGEVTRLDVEASAAERESLEADAASLRIDLAEAQLALDTLLALPPGTVARELKSRAPVPLAEGPIPPGQPIDLLRRRPDLVAAAAALDSADLQALAARRDLLPTLAVQASLGRSGFALGDAISSASNFARLGATFALPLLDYPRRRAAIDLAEVQGEQAFVQFEQAVAQALEDVERALVRLDGQRLRQDALQRTLAHRERAHAMANRSYRLGEANLQDVLDAQRGVLQARRQLLQSRTAVATAQVALYLALGGGWQAGEAGQPERAGRSGSQNLR